MSEWISRRRFWSRYKAETT